MSEIDPLVAEFSHEKHRPREKDALLTLRKIASLVKPIMRSRGWRVGTLAEFYPPETNLLGINYNKGMKICLRLRYPGDANQFLPMEQVVDTMLHELSHNVFGPHDANFHALWNQLRDEYEGLVRKGYTGEGFLSKGHTLGGRHVPRDEARRITRAAAEKRRNLSAGSGQRLGGAGVHPGQDVRRVIVDAIERRATVMKGCGVENKNQREIKAIADEATSNGFRTKAEEDEANEQAIAQALWELVQEDEKHKYGSSYVPPSAQQPLGSARSDDLSLERITATTVKSPPVGTKRPLSGSESGVSSGVVPAAQASRMSRLVAPNPPSYKRPSMNANTKSTSSANSIDLTGPPSNTVAIWECEMCTCHNPLNFLCCDACGTERTGYTTKAVPAPNSTTASQPVSVTSPPVPLATKPKLASLSATWTCHVCTLDVENRWWTCPACGTMKLSS